jgi:DNA-binding HxlR family transcriptional regulator
MSVMIEDLPVKVRPLRRPKPVSLEALLDVQKARPVLEQIANKWSVLILTVLCNRRRRAEASGA